MSNYVYCECRTAHSHDLSPAGSQPFPVNVEYVNDSGAAAWVHLATSNFGPLTPIQFPAGANAVTFHLLNFPADTPGVTMQAHLRDTDDPETGTPLFTEEEQYGIDFWGLGMEFVPALSVSPQCFATPLGNFHYRRFPPKFETPFPALVRVLISGKPLGRAPVLRYDLPGLPTGWVRVRGKWALEYAFVAPNPLVLGTGERPLPVAVLLDLGWKVKDQTHFEL